MRKVRMNLLVAAVALAVVTTSCKKDDPTPDAPVVTTTPSLYTRLGGDAAIIAVTDQFIANVLADPTLADNFVAAGTAGNQAQYNLFRERLIDQLCAATGGPYTYLGKNMFDTHEGMNITDAEFNSLVGALVASLDQFNVPTKEKNDLLAILGPMQTDIVGH